MEEKHHKSISRVDHEPKRMYGWYVRVCYNKKIHAKFFSDARHGGRAKALEAAIAHRNEVERQLGKPRTDRIIVASDRRNNTGVTGVRRTKKATGAYDKDGNPLMTEVFEVTWCPKPGKLRRTSVSIAKYGEKEALKRAIEIRREKERETYGKAVRILPDSE